MRSGELGHEVDDRWLEIRTLGNDAVLAVRKLD
jgi:hypothetical protein